MAWHTTGHRLKSINERLAELERQARVHTFLLTKILTGESLIMTDVKAMQDIMDAAAKAQADAMAKISADVAALADDAKKIADLTAQAAAFGSAPSAADMQALADHAAALKASTDALVGTVAPVAAAAAAAVVPPAAPAVDPAAAPAPAPAV
jgi:hypothetical protein